VGQCGPDRLSGTRILSPDAGGRKQTVVILTRSGTFLVSCGEVESGFCRRDWQMEARPRVSSGPEIAASVTIHKRLAVSTPTTPELESPCSSGIVDAFHRLSWTTRGSELVKVVTCTKPRIKFRHVRVNIHNQSYHLWRLADFGKGRTSPNTEW